jgi:hypothetical protein
MHLRIIFHYFEPATVFQFSLAIGAPGRPEMHDAQVLRLYGLEYLLLGGQWFGAKRYRYEESEQGRETQDRHVISKYGEKRSALNWGQRAKMALCPAAGTAVFSRVDLRTQNA